MTLTNSFFFLLRNLKLCTSQQKLDTRFKNLVIG